MVEAIEKQLCLLRSWWWWC